MSFISDALFGSEPEQTGVAQSPGDVWLQNALWPMIQQGIGAGMGGQQLYPTAQLPPTPTAQGYTAQGYQAPQMPLSVPEMTRQELGTMNQFANQLGGGGGGSARAGTSGMFDFNMERALGDLAIGAGQRAHQYNLPIYGMQADASRFNAMGQNQANQFGAGAQNQMLGMGYQGGLQQMGAQNQAFGAPWNLAGMYSGSTGSPMVQPGQQGAFQSAAGMLPFFGLGNLFGAF